MSERNTKRIEQNALRMLEIASEATTRAGRADMEIETLRTDLAAALQRAEQAERERDQWREGMDLVREDLTDLTERYDALLGDLAAAHRERDAAQAEAKQRALDYFAARNAIDDCERRCEELADTCRAVTPTVEGALAERDAFRARLESAEAALRAVHEHLRSGHLQCTNTGFSTRLCSCGDCGALAAALGAARERSEDG